MASCQQPSSQSTDNVTPAPEKPTYSDSSGAIFSMYVNRAQKFDKENADNWEGQANGILLFSGIFSATVAAFIAISYPNLQQDPDAIRSLLAQISQQLANATSNGGSTNTVNPSTQSPFVPPASVVFINSVWFLSLGLTLTCALIATLMQQWARRYLQMVQRTHAPHVSAQIREYFVHGVKRFGIHALVEVLPTLLLSSVMLFFAGLVVFAFRANHVVAFFTLAIVAFCTLSYIALTVLPLFFPDCPYHTPVTSLIWYGAQIIQLLISYTAHRCAKGLHKLEKLHCAVTEETVKSLQRWHDTKAMSISEGIFSKFEKSAKRSSIDIYRAALGWTLSLLDEDRELEEFVSGLPGLRESEALAPFNNGDDPQCTIRGVLAALPGPTSFHAPFPWSIIRLAQRATTSNLSERARQERLKACLKALYYIPGAIRDLLAPYAAGKQYCLEILPLLNSKESLEIIDELWDTPRDDVALSVRCAAAVVSSFMITPPRPTLEAFLPPNFQFIWDIDYGKQFLSKRLLGTSPAASFSVVPDSDLHSDNARVQNLGRFLEDIKTMLGYIDMPWWARDSAQSIHQERRVLFDARHTPEFLACKGITKQHGNRASPAFIPAVQQDLIALTLEILKRDPIADATPSHREAFQDAYTKLLEVARDQTLPEPQNRDQSLVQCLARSLSLSLPQSWETLLPWPLPQVLSQSPLQSPALSRTPSMGQSLERSPSLARTLAQSLAPSRPQWLTSSLLQPLPQFLAQCFGPSCPQSLPQFLVQLLPQSLLLTQPSAPSSAHGDGVEMVTRAPQQVEEGVGIPPQPEDRPMVLHDGSFPSTTAIPQAASADPSSSSVSSSSLVLRQANPGGRGLSDSAGALV